MSSRKQEERNEKIIRGLMKLPPNRRCINCNHMGPQYACTNFWTFVCVTCSGIHREFTHRVKSVSMATFTSEEVEALQKGGNQRAREIYLKHWDSQSQRLPDNSNADKVREFIRNVYVDKKYLGGGSSDRPPRDLQNGISRDEEIRRASSYHSYSQSPPNDFQYEERRYGKPVPVLTRKPGSDRGLYDGKVSSFLSPGRLSDRSPSRLSDHTNEDSCAAERFGSPLSETSRDFSREDIVQATENPITKSPARKSFRQMLHREGTASLGSSGSLDSLSFGYASHEHEGPVAVHQDRKPTVPSLPQQSFSGSSNGLDLFNAPFAPTTVSSTSATNVSRLPGSSSTRLIDLLDNSPTANAPTFSSSQQLQPILFPSLDMFPTTYHEPSAVTSDKPPFIPQNEGWATFDSPQPVVPLGTANIVGAEKSASDANLVGNSDEHQLFGQWPSVQNNSAHEPLPVMPPFWNADMQNIETLPSTSSSEPWSAFEDSCSNLGKNEGQVPVHQYSFPDQYLPTEPEMGHSHELENKSMNPFDLPYDAENMFFEMGSLQAVLPNVQAPSPFTSGANEHWFAQDIITPYVDVGSDGGFGYTAGHAQSAQILTVSSPGSVASVGGNPFA